MARIYLEIAQPNARIQHDLRIRLPRELPADLTVGNAHEEGAQRYWVSYPDRYGEDSVQAALRDALAKLRITDIKIAE